MITPRVFGLGVFTLKTSGPLEVGQSTHDYALGGGNTQKNAPDWPPTRAASWSRNTASLARAEALHPRQLYIFNVTGS